MSSLSAATAATSSPTYRTVVSKTKLSVNQGIFGMLAELTTAWTPGNASARLVSMPMMRACGCGLRSTAA